MLVWIALFTDIIIRIKSEIYIYREFYTRDEL